MFIVFLILELPYVVLLIWGFILKNHEVDSTPEPLTYPDVAVALTCYSEGELIELAIESLAMQDYKGKITALVIVDGGSRFNRPTVEAGYRMQAKYPNIDVQVVDKPNRHGRVHSNNLGLKYCQENNIEYLLILDGDTSISLESISSFVRMAEHDKEMAGLSGSIKVRNLNSHITKLTYLEYALGIVLSRFALGRLGYTNNISGAKYQFRFPYTVMYS